MGSRSATQLISRWNMHKAEKALPSRIDQPQTEGPPSAKSDQRISVVITDANQMTAELLGRALSRVKTLNIMKSVVSLREAV